MEAQFWIDHVSAIKREGISASAYAKQHGLSLPAVYYWQRKLRAESEVRDTASLGGKFIELRVAEQALSPRSSNCTLILASGIRLEMVLLPSPEWLAALGQATRGAH
jgi:hypothetical protein